jgi:hypothetical protein
MATTLYRVVLSRVVVPRRSAVTRSHRRRLVVPAVAAALALPTGLLAACSAGQLAATSLITSAVPGAQASVNTGLPDETIQIANATVDYNGPQGYPAGGNASLSLWIFNNTSKDITLTGVGSATGTTGPTGQVVISNGAAPGIPSVCQNSARPIQPNPSTGAPNNGVAPSMGASGGISPQGPTGTPSNNSVAKPTSSAQESASASASGSASAEPSGSATPSAAASAATAGSTKISITVKADGCVALTRQSSQFLQVTNLSGVLRPGKTVNLSFTFQQTGGGQFTIGTDKNPLAVPVDVPSSPDPRQTAAVPAATD